MMWAAVGVILGVLILGGLVVTFRPDGMEQD